MITITHRLSLVQHCDRIAVLDQGHLVAIGSHSQLIEHSRIYRNLVNSQSIDE